MRRLALLLILMLPGTASAATWSEPQRLTTHDGSAGGGSIAFTQSGRAYAAWSLGFVGPQCVGHCGSPVSTDYATRPRGGTWTAPTRTGDVGAAIVGTEDDEAL